jgi:hypothetical protein
METCLFPSSGDSIACGIEDEPASLFYPVEIGNHRYPLYFGQGGWAGIRCKWPVNQKRCIFVLDQEACNSIFS